MHLSKAIKDAGIRLPVIGAGRQDSQAFADQTIKDGHADIIGMAKTLIADPYFPNKAREGRVDDIRTCIACTQSCVGHADKGLGIGCIYNPVTGREEQWGELDPADERKRVVMVKGRPRWYGDCPYRGHPRASGHCLRARIANGRPGQPRHENP